MSVDKECSPGTSRLVMAQILERHAFHAGYVLLVVVIHVLAMLS